MSWYFCSSAWLEPKLSTMYFSSARAANFHKAFWLGSSWIFFGSLHPYSAPATQIIQKWNGAPCIQSMSIWNNKIVPQGNKLGLLGSLVPFERDWTYPKNSDASEFELKKKKCIHKNLQLVSGVWIILFGFHFLVILEKFQYSIIDFEILISSIEFYGWSGVLFSGYCTYVWSYRKISNACKLNWRFIDFAEQNEQTKMEQKRYKIALYA